MSFPSLVHALFTFYTTFIFARIALSWLPSLYRFKASRFLVWITDPYMNLFRKLLPPIGGVLDLSPMLALLSLRFLESFLLRAL